MPVYSFPFPAASTGATVVVLDTAGGVVATDTLGSPDASGSIAYEVTLDEGVYVAVLAATPGSSRVRPGPVPGTLDIVDSIAEGGGVGASETAYFVATGQTHPTDAATHDLTLAVDPRHGDLPDWVTIVDGSAVLGENAGTCAFSLSGFIDLDFSDASSIPDDPGRIFSYLAVAGDGDFYEDTGSTNTPGTGETTQTVPKATTSGVLKDITFTVSASAAAFATGDESQPIADGASTPRVAFTITRIAQAAVPPE